MTARADRPRLHQRMEALRLDDSSIGIDGRGCAWPGCTAHGSFPAPRSRERLRDFVWFCLDHVRDYNRSWNYFEGMNEADVEAHLRADVTWHRPCWPFGGVGVGENPFADPFGFFHEEATERRRTREAHRAAGPDAKAAAMMRILGVETGFTPEELRQRYKQLVKMHHPDLHGGDRDAEERLKQINEAYSFLREAYAAAG